MALNTSKCNHLTPLRFKGLTQFTLLRQYHHSPLLFKLLNAVRKHKSHITGIYACQSELHSRWRRWRTVHCTALHHHTWRRHSHVSPTYCTDAGSGPPPLIGLTFQLAVCQQLEIVIFLKLVQRCRTACQAMWHQLRRWRCSRTGLRRTYSAAAMKLFD